MTNKLLRRIKDWRWTLAHGIAFPLVRLWIRQQHESDGDLVQVIEILFDVIEESVPDDAKQELKHWYYKETETKDD